MDGLACLLHRHMVCSLQTRRQSFLSGVAPSRHTVVGGGAFSGGASPRVWIFDVVLTV
jgi:hypothetical protein